MANTWVRVSTSVRYALRHRSTRRKLYWGVGILIGLGVVWLLVTAMQIREQVQQLRTDLLTVRAELSQGRLADARALATRLPAETARIERLSSGPAWWVAAHVPYLGDPVATMRGVADALDRIGNDAIPPLIDLAGKLDPKKLRVGGATLDLNALIAARPELSQAAAAFGQAEEALDGLDYNTWLSSLNAPASQVAQQMDSMRGYVLAAQRGASVLPAMLGEHGPVRYFIGLQNEAEMRGTGGLPGAFAIAVADHGTLRFTHFESDAVLLPSRSKQRVPTGLNFGRAYAGLYGASAPTESYQDSNVSPNFPYAAQVWAAMWQKVSGEKVDGAVALDPSVLSYLLQATGAVRVPTSAAGTLTVDSGNVVSLLQRDEYALFADNGERRAFNVAVLKKVATRVTGGAGSASGLTNAVVTASAQHRFLVWSRVPSIEKELGPTSYSGTFPSLETPLVAPIMNDAAAGKLDYYLTRSIDYTRTGCGPDRDVRVTLTITNTAPGSGLPLYVTGRLDKDRPANVKPGDTRTLLDYYGTAGGSLLSVTLNGEPSTANVQELDGHPVYRFDLELPRGRTQTLVLHLDEPAGKGEPVVWQQPGVTPVTVSVQNQSCP